MRALAPLLILFVFACASGRKAMEKASLYEREGMLQEAFVQYEQVYLRDPRNTLAHLGMRRTAQQQFDRIQMEASGLFLAGNLADGEKKRQEAAAFKQGMDRKRLELQWDPIVEQRRQEARANEALRLYTEAETAFRADRFEQAQELVGRSLSLDPANKDAEYLRKISQLEPLYRQGQRAMGLGLWRDAFRSFKSVTDRDAGYKDSWELMARARDEAALVIAYVPLFNNGLYANNLALTSPGTIETHLAATIKQSILDLKDPLLMLVDRDNTDQLLAEQQRQMSGVYDERYVVEAGKLIGARYVLTGRLLRYDEILRREIELQMQLLDAENGRIHLSEIVRVNKQELARGNTRTQLLERAAKRMAHRVAQFDPHQR